MRYTTDNPAALAPFVQGAQRVGLLPAPAVDYQTGYISAILSRPPLHVLLCDWDDGLPVDLVRRVAAARIPDLHLFESSPGRWHGYSFAARPAPEIARLQRALGSDANHSRAGLAVGWWVLRKAVDRYAGAIKGACPDEAAHSLTECEFSSTWADARLRGAH